MDDVSQARNRAAEERRMGKHERHEADHTDGTEAERHREAADRHSDAAAAQEQHAVEKLEDRSQE